MIAALDPSDARKATIWVAGPGALLVAKVHKIAERSDDDQRVRDKDALDVLRLLRAIPTDDFADRVKMLRTDDLAGAVTSEALEQVTVLFGSPKSVGVTMAARAAGGAEDGAVIADSFVALVEDLQASLA